MAKLSKAQQAIVDILREQVLTAREQLSSGYSLNDYILDYARGVRSKEEDAQKLADELKNDPYYSSLYLRKYDGHMRNNRKIAMGEEMTLTEGNGRTISKLEELGYIKKQIIILYEPLRVTINLAAFGISEQFLMVGEEQEKRQRAQWGGARTGAGRKPSGRKQHCVWATDEEYKAIKDLLERMRGEK